MEQIKVLVSGAAGRMGREVVKAVVGDVETPVGTGTIAILKLR